MDWDLNAARNVAICPCFMEVMRISELPKTPHLRCGARFYD